jgi:flagellar motor switch protein FliN/FliY
MNEANITADTPLPRTLEPSLGSLSSEKAFATVARVPEFTSLTPTSLDKAGGPLDRLMDVSVTVTAELGRIVFSIDTILKLGVGSVVELARPVSDPIDLMVQGVRFARGEVVVVDDCFAVRIKEIAEPKKK